MSVTGVIHTPDQRLRVFVSSTLEELAAERRAVRDAVTRLRLVPVMFELGAAGLLRQGLSLAAEAGDWLHAYVPRAPHDHSVEAELRSRMGDAAYEQAAAHGRSLTGARGIQQGLAEAQRDSQRRESPA